MNGQFYPKKLDIKDIGKEVKALVKDKDVGTLLGVAPTSHGIFVLLFSHRYNQDHTLLVSGADLPTVLTKVSEALLP